MLHYLCFIQETIKKHILQQYWNSLFANVPIDVVDAVDQNRKQQINGKATLVIIKLINRMLCTYAAQLMTSVLSCWRLNLIWIDFVCISSNLPTNNLSA